MTKLEAGSLVGSSEVNAAIMAVEDRGMVTKVSVVPYDDGWQPEKARKAWAQLRQDGIDLVVTSHVSTCALAIAELAAGQDVLIFITGATTNALSGLDDESLRIVPDVAAEQDWVAAWTAARRYSSILIVRDTENWAYTEPAFSSFSAGIGSGRLRELPIAISSYDAAALRLAMAAEPFDLAYMLIGGYNSAAGTIAQLARLVEPGCDVLFTPWLKTPTLVQTAGPALERAYMPAFYPPRGGNPAVDRHIDRYKERFGYAPTFISLNVYAAFEVLLDGIEKGMRKPKELRGSIMGSKVPTSFGTVGFDRYGDVVRDLYMIEDIAGEF